MKKYMLIFLVTIFTTANAKSITVARIGISQSHIRNQKLDKDSENTLTFAIGRRYYPWEPSHFYWGFDIIYSQAKLATKKVSFPDIGIGIENYVRLMHYNFKYENFEIPILLGLSHDTFRKSSINIESGFLLSLAYKMDSDGKYDVIQLKDEEREEYKFDFTWEKYNEPNPLALNFLISANFIYQYIGIEFRYRRALSKIGSLEHLPNQYFDSFIFNILFFF